jgi:hypothetical protein
MDSALRSIDSMPRMVLLAGVVVALALVPLDGHAQESSNKEKKKSSASSTTISGTSSKPKPKPKKFPIAGNVSISTSLGLGALVPGEQNNPDWSSSLNLTMRGSPVPGILLLLSQSINKTIYDSFNPFAPRARNTSISDPVILINYSPRVADDGPKEPKKKVASQDEATAAALNPTLAGGSGEGKPLSLPGGIRVGFSGIFLLGMGKASRYQQRYGTAMFAVNFSKGWKKLSLTYQPRFTKHFHKYSNAVVDSRALTEGSMARDGGVEDLGSGLIATNFSNFSYGIRNRMIAGVTLTGKLSLQFFYQLQNLFRYYDAPLDDLSGKHAKGGRGRLDLQFGSVTLNYLLPHGYITSFSTSTWSTPWSADNQTYRFPFFDFISASENITSFSLSLTKMF